MNESTEGNWWKKYSTDHSITFRGSSFSSTGLAEPNMLATPVPRPPRPDLSSTFPTVSFSQPSQAEFSKHPLQAIPFHNPATLQPESTLANNPVAHRTYPIRHPLISQLPVVPESQETYARSEQADQALQRTSTNAKATSLPVHGSQHRPLERGREAAQEQFQDVAFAQSFPQAHALRTTQRSCTSSSSGEISAPATTSATATSPGAMSSQQLPKPINPYASRCFLHIRQQPRAARAGPDGKDRRPVDPPPILQLMMSGFDPESLEDVAEMHAQFVVHCKLVSINSPRKEMSTIISFGDDGSREIQRLLLGTYVASPFHTKDDPDPPTMLQHPSLLDQNQRPPSPTSRFLPSAKSPRQRQLYDANIPGAFFIFADISVRKAGEYRLEFSLMKMDRFYLMAGKTLPILHTVTSDTFRVVNAKDFDQVQASTPLVRGLLERGAGFPLKLKKGTREGGRRRNASAEHSGSDDDDDEEAIDEDDGE